jgi:hypothetical protein
MSRAQLDHLLLDVDYFDKPKVKAAIFKFGPIAALLLIRVDCLLSRATNALIPRDAARGAAYELRIDSDLADKILDFAISTEMLQGDSENLTSARVAEDQEKLFRTREKWREKNEKKKSNSGVPIESTNGNTPIPVNTEQLNTEDLKDLKKDSQPFEEIDPDRIMLPPQLNTPEFRSALKPWVLKCRKNGRPLDQITFEAQIHPFVNEPKRLIKALIFSTGLSQCFNLIEAKSAFTNERNQPKSGAPPIPKPQKHDLIFDEKLKAMRPKTKKELEATP